jgi:hypothetical protein
MQRALRFTDEAKAQLKSLKDDPPSSAELKQIYKALGYLETNPRHPSLNTHEFTSLTGPGGEKVFEAYAQNNTPGAYRIFWHYGPDEFAGNRRISVISVVAITPHP